MKYSFVVLSIIIIVILSSCSSRGNNSLNHQESSMLENDISEACKEPPKSFTWNKKTYILKTIGDRELEPGMKLGYLACNNGIYKMQGEGPNAIFNIYSFGSHSDELLYFGEWGRALYTTE